MITTVGSLRAALDELDLDDDVELRVAIQPAWPLVKALQGVTLTPLQGSADPADDEPDVIWLVVSDEVPDESRTPYAPDGIYDEVLS